MTQAATGEDFDAFFRLAYDKSADSGFAAFPYDC